MGAPRYLKVCLMSMICSVAVLIATNSDPYVAVSTVACFLEYKSTGVLLTMLTEVCQFGHFWLSYGRSVMSGSPIGWTKVAP